MGGVDSKVLVRIFPCGFLFRLFHVGFVLRAGLPSVSLFGVEARLRNFQSERAGYGRSNEGYRAVSINVVPDFWVE